MEEEKLLAERMRNVPRSFIREILKVAISPEVISFAGGLPNKDLFPMQDLQAAAQKLLTGADRNIFQYSNTEGYLPLRQKIAARYKAKGLSVNPNNILITNGSQQGLDLLSKIFINEGDAVLIEEPGYLGAIQAMSVFRPRFVTVPLNSDGVDVTRFEQVVNQDKPKLAYLITNFQNPSGITYTNEVRQRVTDVCRGRDMFLIEDDPYGDIRFKGNHHPSLYHYLPEQTIMLGTFSKTLVPSFRLGWVVAPDAVMDKLIVAKQAADLHTDYFAQRLVNQYLEDVDADKHIAKICECYGRQAAAMLQAVKRYLPQNVQYTEPEGGMFMWLTFPEDVDAMDLFQKAIARNVAFVPGNPFYVNRERVNTCRLNFSCSNEATIEKGIKILGEVLEEM